MSKKYDFYSAGTKKHGLNSNAIKVMSEVGIDISTHQSNLVEELEVDTFDLVVTVCSDANENCPFLPNQRVVHHGFDDPPRLTLNYTDSEETLNVYRRVRDEIRSFVEQLDKFFYDR